jgi:hypothetical protein
VNQALQAELQAIVTRQIDEAAASAEADLAALRSELVADKARAEQALVNCVGRLVRESGQFRPGAEGPILELARAAHWESTSSGLSRRKANGELTGADDFGWWLQHVKLPPMLRDPGRVSPDDARAFVETLEMVATGSRQVGPLLQRS